MGKNGEIFSQLGNNPAQRADAAEPSRVALRFLRAFDSDIVNGLGQLVLRGSIPAPRRAAKALAAGLARSVAS
jgi:hypothetical protein